ncbi:recombinase family protein [Clostridium amazonitimonense]|uniref:recombinase family protein n=1 Tax=Clostridium amazonitimonense TaxID=1499689 RepID=UPI000509E587|nr:recombinase family protein [Clostridium amazonitimonense]
MKAAIYSRKSKITNVGDSIENQIQLCRDYGINLNIDEFIIYEDEGFSGKNTKRPHFQKMLEDARNNKFDIIICYRLDRISRNLSDFTNLIDELDNLNIQFISIREQFDTSSPMGKAMMYIASIFAQLERETIAQRVQDNMIELAKTGRWLGGQTPLGYKSQCNVYEEETGKVKKIYELYPIDEEIKVVKLIYDLYEKKRSLNKVKNFINENNIPSKSNISWTSKRIQLILRSPVYVKSSLEVLEYLKLNGIDVLGTPNGNGILIYNKTKNIKVKRDRSQWIAAISNHEGVIDPTNWLQIQHILDSNSKSPPSIGKSNTALLVGLLKCDKCKGNMHIKHGHIKANSKERILYYVCENKSNSKGKLCNNGNINMEEVDEAILSSISNIPLNSNKFIKYLLKNIKYKDYLSYTNNINNEILYNEKKIENLVTQLSLTPELSKYITPKILEMETSIEKLKNHQKSKTLLSENISYIKNISKDYFTFDSIMSKLTVDDKKYILRELIESIYFNEKDGILTINYKTLI